MRMFLYVVIVLLTIFSEIILSRPYNLASVEGQKFVQSLSSKEYMIYSTVVILIGVFNYIFFRILGNKILR